MKKTSPIKAALMTVSTAVAALALSSCAGLVTSNATKKSSPAAKQPTTATTSMAAAQAPASASGSNSQQAATAGKAKADGSTSKGRKTVAK